MSALDKPVFTPVCAWIVDQRQNQYCFGDWSHEGLYRAELPDAQGHRYVVGTQITTSRTWITDEEAVKLMKKHLVLFSDLDTQERVLLIQDFKSERVPLTLKDIRERMGG